VLRRAIASRLGIDLDQIILGNGSVEVIEMVARAYLADGDEAVFSEQSFVSYQIAVDQVNGTATAVPARTDRGHDLVGMAKAIGERTKIVYLANPCNPTGTYATRTELDAFFRAIGDHVLVVVDQAYQEYVDKPDYLTPLMISRRDTTS